MRNDRCYDIYTQQQYHFLQNLKIYAGNALDITKNLIIKNTIHCIYINFPQPQPCYHNTAQDQLLNQNLFDNLYHILSLQAGYLIVLTDNLWICNVIVELLKTYYQHKFQSVLSSNDNDNIDDRG